MTQITEIASDMYRISTFTQPTLCRTNYTATHRAINDGHALCLGRLGKAQRLCQGNGAADHNSTACHGLQQAIPTVHDRVNLLPVDHHAHHPLTRRANLRWMLCRPALPER
jgi:hypothetical protein